MIRKGGRPGPACMRKDSPPTPAHSYAFRAQGVASTSGRGPTMESIAESLGARKFISETELEQIKATRGARADDGGAAG